MPSTKKTTTNTKQKTVVEKETCIKCKKLKSLKSDFYSTSSHLYPSGNYPTCKSCIQERLPNETNPLNNKYLKNIKDLLLELNKPFIHSLWLSSIDESKRRGWSAFNCYMKNVQMPQHRNKTWNDSIVDESKKENEENLNVINVKTMSECFIPLEELKEKYGYGYPDEEYYLFEKKYMQLRPSFSLVTTMHEEYFKEYCVNRTKETLAKASGAVKVAKDWADLAENAATSGKLKPSQMSKADLSGGLDTFGQLARMVEEHNEILPLLPKFIEKPKDKIDVTLWCFVNYIRDLKSMPECSYKEIYNFYEQRKKDYEENMLDNDYETHTDSEEVNTNGKI